MIKLCVNIDHVATIRQARKTVEPDPVVAATEAVLGGADGITLHVREDRRHVQDADLFRLREIIKVPLNLELSSAHGFSIAHNHKGCTNDVGVRLVTVLVTIVFPRPSGTVTSCHGDCRARIRCIEPKEGSNLELWAIRAVVR